MTAPVRAPKVFSDRRRCHQQRDDEHQCPVDEPSRDQTLRQVGERHRHQHGEEDAVRGQHEMGPEMAGRPTEEGGGEHGRGCGPARRGPGRRQVGQAGVGRIVGVVAVGGGPRLGRGLLQVAEGRRRSPGGVGRARRGRKLRRPAALVLQAAPIGQPPAHRVQRTADDEPGDRYPGDQQRVHAWQGTGPVATGGASPEATPPGAGTPPGFRDPPGPARPAGGADRSDRSAERERAGRRRQPWAGS